LSKDPTEVAADELAELAPRLGQWVPPSGRRTTWPDITAAAGPLCTEIGVPHRLWAEACAQMGVHKAAIALAIVASKPEPVIRKSYAAYFTGMIRRHEAGALNLERSLWKLRRDSWKGTRH
jgi:hypothetical protein